LVQLQDQHDVGREVEFVPKVTGLQVRVEDSNLQLFKVLRIVREETDEG